ncbi:MAG: hypothetical protein ACKVVP_11045 [Chloroflexota bacterium]
MRELFTHAGIAARGAYIARKRARSDTIIGMSNSEGQRPQNAIPVPGQHDRIISWRGVSCGFLLAAGLALILGLAGGWTHASDNPGYGPAMQFLSLAAGAYLAGQIAGRAGLMQGVAVAAVFIFVGVSYTALVEMNLVSKYGHQVLRPMDSTSMILTDLLHLIAGSLGGLLADRTSSRDPGA